MCICTWSSPALLSLSTSYCTVNTPSTALSVQFTHLRCCCRVGLNTMWAFSFVWVILLNSANCSPSVLEAVTSLIPLGSNIYTSTWGDTTINKTHNTNSCIFLYCVWKWPAAVEPGVQVVSVVCAGRRPASSASFPDSAAQTPLCCLEEHAPPS